MKGHGATDRLSGGFWVYFKSLYSISRGRRQVHPSYQSLAAFLAFRISVGEIGRDFARLARLHGDGVRHLDFGRRLIEGCVSACKKVQCRLASKASPKRPPRSPRYSPGRSATGSASASFWPPSAMAFRLHQGTRADRMISSIL